VEVRFISIKESRAKVILLKMEQIESSISGRVMYAIIQDLCDLISMLSLKGRPAVKRDTQKVH
jgi:hypothetical protein